MCATMNHVQSAKTSIGNSECLHCLTSYNMSNTYSIMIGKHMHYSTRKIFLFMTSDTSSLHTTKRHLRNDCEKLTLLPSLPSFVFHHPTRYRAPPVGKRFW